MIIGLFVDDALWFLKDTKRMLRPAAESSRLLAERTIVPHLDRGVSGQLDGAGFLGHTLKPAYVIGFFVSKKETLRFLR